MGMSMRRVGLRERPKTNKICQNKIVWVTKLKILWKKSFNCAETDFSTFPASTKYFLKILKKYVNLFFENQNVITEGIWWALQVLAIGRFSDQLLGKQISKIFFQQNSKFLGLDNY